MRKKYFLFAITVQVLSVQPIPSFSPDVYNLMIRNASTVTHKQI